MGKPDRIGEIYVILGMLQLFRHYVLAQAQAQFHEAGPDINPFLLNKFPLILIQVTCYSFYNAE